MFAERIWVLPAKPCAHLNDLPSLSGIYSAVADCGNDQSYREAD
jgi:hypothetical protein